MKSKAKLLEVVSLTLLLGAGILGWLYVQDATNAKSNLRNSLASARDAFTVTDTKNAIRLEAAVTRATVGRGLPASAMDNYAYAWNSPEVREAWLSRTEDEVQNLANLLLAIRSSEDRYGLRNETDDVVPLLADLKSDIIEVRAVLAAEADTEGAFAFTGSDASSWSDKIGPIHSLLVGLMTDTSHRLAEKASRRAWIYQAVFILGSALLVLARALEWRAERRHRTISARVEGGV